MEKEVLIDLVQRSQDGDMEAFEKLLLHAHTSVSYQCRKMLKNEQDAEDMTQEVLVTVYQKLDTLKEPAAFNKWLHQITASRCINALTRTHVEFQIAEDEEGHSILDTLEEMDEKKIPEKWLDTKETTRMIEEIVDGLPEVQRMCTLMFYYSELSVKEISRIMKVSENTIKSRLNYARKAIKEKVLDYEKKGVKLYGLSPLPFIYYFLHKRKDEDKDPVAGQIMVSEILAQSTFVAAGIVNAAGSASAGASGTAAAVTGTAGAAATAAGTTGLFGTLGALSTKAIAGITAALVAIGGVTVAATVGDDSGQEAFAPTIVLEEQENGSGLEDIVILETVEATEATETTEETEAATEITEPGVDENTSTGTGSQESSGGNEDTSVGSDGNTSSGSDSTTEIDLTAHTHQYVVAYTETPCCQQQGYTEYECSFCGAYYADNFTETLPHNYTATVVAPTAYSQGYTKYECTSVCSHVYQHANYSTRCLDIYITDYTDKLASDTDTSGCTHSFIETTIRAATCYDEGIQKYTCEDCDFSYTEVVPKYTEHEWVLEEGIASAPGCDWDGNEGYWCNHCRLWKPDDIIPALGHEYSTTVVAPTETTRGYTEFTCSRCGNSFKDNYTELTDGTTALHTHSYTSVITPPTCGDYGYTTYTCECGHSYTGEQVTNLGCQYSTSVVNPTETEQGYTEYTCTVCGSSYKADYTDPTGDETTHNHEYVVSRLWEPCCCQHQGYTVKTCTLCGSEVTTDFVDPLPHDYVGTVVAPTAYSQGYTLYECSWECNETYTGDYVDKLPEDTSASDHTHNFTGTVTLQNTCHGEGIMTYTCGSCDYSYTEVLAKLEHDWVYSEVASQEPGCTYDGFEALACTKCNYAKTETVLPALGHDYITTVVAPTATERGYTEFTCNRCGVSFKDNYTEMLPDGSTSSHTHSYTTVVTAPTCTTDGYTTYSCACGHGYTADNVYSYGHSYTSNVIPPTETEQGYTEHTCATCGDTYKDSYTDPVATAGAGDESHTHSYTSAVTAATCTTDGYTTYTCLCGDTYTADETAATGHSYTSNVIPPTETEQGYTEHTCATCGDTYKDNYTDPVATAGVADESHTHSYTSAVTAATCTADGYTTYTCLCGDSYTADETAATGHSYTSNVIPPTETERGYTEHTCTACGDSYRDSYTDALTSE